MEKKRFKVKFFGSKENKGQITLQKMIVEAYSEEGVEYALNRMGWVKINGLKISLCNE